MSFGSCSVAFFMGRRSCRMGVGLSVLLVPCATDSRRGGASALPLFIYGDYMDMAQNIPELRTVAQLLNVIVVLFTVILIWAWRNTK